MSGLCGHAWGCGGGGSPQRPGHFWAFDVCSGSKFSQNTHCTHKKHSSYSHAAFWAYVDTATRAHGRCDRATNPPWRALEHVARSTEAGTLWMHAQMMTPGFYPGVPPPTQMPSLLHAYHTVHHLDCHKRLPWARGSQKLAAVALAELKEQPQDGMASTTRTSSSPSRRQRLLRRVAFEVGDEWQLHSSSHRACTLARRS